MDKDIIPIAQIEERIYVLRGKRVMLDAAQRTRMVAYFVSL